MEDKKKSKKARWIGIGLGAAAVLLGGGYTAAYFVAGNQVPAHASAAEVPIGGMSPAEAEQALRDALADRYESPLTLTSPDASTELDPAKAGLAVDYAATIESAGGGFSWNPVHIYRAFTGGEAVPLVFDIDDEQLAQAVAGTESTFAKDAVNATIALNDGKPSTTEAVEGAKLKTQETTDAVRSAYEAGKSEVDVAVETIAPSVTDEQVAAFRDGKLQQAIGSDVTLTSPNGDLTIPAAEIGKLIRITGEGTDLGYAVDETALEELTAEDLDKLNENGPTPASYSIQGSTITVVPSKKGMVLEPEHVRAAFTSAIDGTERKVAMKGEEKEPEFSTAKAEELKPKEVIGEYTTNYPHAAYRNTNIGTAAKRISGTVLMPGETFSLNDTVGRRTVENGFAEGYVINGGNLVKEAGGGVSQAATTLFNASFFAGFEDVEHKPHSLYFSRYPAGREATVYYGSVDLRFKNNTDYPAIIQGWIDPSASGKRGSVTFRIWSTKTWDKVTSTDLVKSDYYNGTERVSTAANCEPQAPQQGFTVTYKRLFHKGGKVVKEEPFRWKYSAGDRITCE